jgi:predicted Fe-Mo cluster-binding NifX family protein
MRLIVTSNTRERNGDVSDVFGRCKFFLLFEEEKGEIKLIEVFENINSRKAGGAGISAAQAVAERDAKAVLSGNIGPRAREVFRQFGIKMYKASGKIEEALDLMANGKLEEIG